MGGGVYNLSQQATIGLLYYIIKILDRDDSALIEYDENVNLDNFIFNVDIDNNSLNTIRGEVLYININIESSTLYIDIYYNLYLKLNNNIIFKISSAIFSNFFNYISPAYSSLYKFMKTISNTKDFSNASFTFINDINKDKVLLFNCTDTDIDNLMETIEKNATTINNLTTHLKELQDNKTTISNLSKYLADLKDNEKLITKELDLYDKISTLSQETKDNLDALNKFIQDNTKYSESKNIQELKDGINLINDCIQDIIDYIDKIILEKSTFDTKTYKITNNRKKNI